KRRGSASRRGRRPWRRRYRPRYGRARRRRGRDARSRSSSLRAHSPASPPDSRRAAPPWMRASSPRTAHGRMLKGGHDAAQLGKALEAADGGIARLRLPLEVVENILPVVGPHRDVAIGPAGGLAAAFLGEDRID